MEREPLVLHDPEPEIDRLTIAYILEIVQAYLNGSNPNGDDVSRNGPLIEEIYSRINELRARKTI